MRALRFLFFLACAAVIAGGIWYVQNGGFGDEEEDVAEDEEGFGERVDGGAPRRRQTKKAPRLKSKTKEAPHARGGPAHHAAGPAAAGPSGMSYEAAIAGNNLKLAPGAKDAPDLTDAELAGPMRDGSFLDACGVPTSTHVTVKVAIRNGHAVGVSVYPVPPNANMAGCVERHVRGLRWPSNAKMDSFVTTY